MSQAVKQNGWALQYVKRTDTRNMSQAVKQNREALRFVKEQTPEILDYLKFIK